ncbi:MAG: glycosyltransferase family 2 protein [Alphaproteobacteria bacterium]
MKLSIITICYNIKNEIRRTCESIINQSYQDFEWIIVDGGSTDGTLDVLNEYKDRINIFISEKDGGIYDAMNKGILKASGEYINFMNGGDCFYDEKSLKIATSFICDKDIYYGNSKFLTKDDFFIKDCPNVLPNGWFKNDCIPHQSCYIKKELFDKYGLYNPNNKIVSDWEKWIIFIEVNKSSYQKIDEILSIHNYTGISSTNSEQHVKERASVIDKYYNEVVSSFVKVKTYKKILGLTWLKTTKTETIKSFYLFGWLPILKIRRFV